MSPLTSLVPHIGLVVVVKNNKPTLKAFLFNPSQMIEAKMLMLSFDIFICPFPFTSHQLGMCSHDSYSVETFTNSILFAYLWTLSMQKFANFLQILSSVQVCKMT